VDNRKADHGCDTWRYGGLSNFVHHNREEYSIAFQDIKEGINSFKLWTSLSWQDIKHRYQRSRLGPFWLTIPMAVTVTSLGILYSYILHIDVSDYLPFLAVSFILWEFISSFFVQGCSTFIENAGMIKQLNAPLSIYVLKVVTRNLIVFAHNFIIYFIILIIFKIDPGIGILLAVAGLLILCINGFWISMLLGLISARFRDMPQIVLSIMQFLFFATPIIWKPELLKDKQFIVLFNPVYYFFEIVRAPLLNYPIDLFTWAVAGIITICGLLVTFLFFCKYNRKLAYWV
jgi:lipopolysaccharide transport system permease protein